MKEPYTAEELLEHSRNTPKLSLDKDRLLATFANENNWYLDTSNSQRGIWTWIGPFIPPFEFATL